MIIDLIAKRIAYYFLKEKIINGEECEIFAYGITLILPYYLECLIIIIISITFDSVRSSIVYIITFTMIRDYVGGDRNIMNIHKEWFTWGDSYELDILDPDYELISLGIVLAIDTAMAAANTASSASAR